jgi:hypothetical protein
MIFFNGGHPFTRMKQGSNGLCILYNRYLKFKQIDR